MWPPNREIPTSPSSSLRPPPLVTIPRWQAMASRITSCWEHPDRRAALRTASSTSGLNRRFIATPL